LTSTKADRQAHESGVSVDVVSIVVRVSDLDRSLKFYCDVFSCRVAVREADMALLLTPKGFEIYLHQNDEFHSRAAGALGVRHLMWATDSQSVCSASPIVCARTTAPCTHTPWKE
jgi:catechol-2,3-dioxygenase